MMSENPIRDAMSLSAAEFAEAIRQITRRGAIHFDVPKATPSPGTETGTTTHTGKSPAPRTNGSSGDAMQMSDKDWREALRNLGRT